MTKPGRRYRFPQLTTPPASEQSLDSPNGQAFQRARQSLQGLVVGDCFGEMFFGPVVKMISCIIQRELPEGPWRYTDDSEMALSIVDTLDRHGTIDQDELAQAFAWRFNERRGYGGGAWQLLRSIRAGAYWKDEASAMFGGTGSYGNGGAMRVAPLGAFFADDLDRAQEEARRSAEVTHQHPEGIVGAEAIALAAALRWQEGENPSRTPQEIMTFIAERLPMTDTRIGIEQAAAMPPDVRVDRVTSVLGAGSQVSAQDTVPFCLWCAFHHLDNYEEALWTTVSGLGDRDTTCAIVGGILATHPSTKPPATWLERSEEFSLETP